MSGGVDSTVAAVLARRTLGRRLVTVHIDHGFVRENESQQVITGLKALGLETVLVDASRTFMDSLSGLQDGDAKRKKIGELFIRTFEDVANRNLVTTLIQGTIAPDAIESSRGMSAKRRGTEHGGMIKLHHNVGGLPKEMWIRVLEPIRDLFKYQVRALGEALGIPDRLLQRQPFPGPGLSVRIAGSVDPQVVEVLRTATRKVERALASLKPAQYFVYLIARQARPDPQARRIAMEVLGPSLTISAYVHKDLAVGVKGDERVLGRIVSLRIEMDGRSALSPIPWLDLLRLQSAITGRIRDVCRVLLVLCDKKDGDLAAVIRSVETRDFMTAMPSQIPFERLYRLGAQLLQLPLLGAVLYEITTKPSSTIELE